MPVSESSMKCSLSLLVDRGTDHERVIEEWEVQIPIWCEVGGNGRVSIDIDQVSDQERLRQRVVGLLEDAGINSEIVPDEVPGVFAPDGFLEFAFDDGGQPMVDEDGVSIIFRRVPWPEGLGDSFLDDIYAAYTAWVRGVEMPVRKNSLAQSVEPYRFKTGLWSGATCSELEAYWAGYRQAETYGLSEIPDHGLRYPESYAYIRGWERCLVNPAAGGSSSGRE